MPPTPELTRVPASASAWDAAPLRYHFWCPSEGFSNQDWQGIVAEVLAERGAVGQAGLVTSNARDRTALLTLDVDGGTFRLRRAARADLPGILRLLADDQLGTSREDTSGPAPYEKAFAAIDADPAHLLLVGELVPAAASGTRLVATFQLSFLPGLSRGGSWRAQLEAVRVASDLRGHGV